MQINHVIYTPRPPSENFWVLPNCTLAPLSTLFTLPPERGPAVTCMVHVIDSPNRSLIPPTHVKFLAWGSRPAVHPRLRVVLTRTG